MTVIRTSEDLRRAIKTLNWSAAELARRTRSHPNTASRWLNGGKVPGPVAAFVDLVLAFKPIADRF